MKCEICGKEIEKSMYYGSVLCSSECHTEKYWLDRVKAIEKDPYEFTIIDGTCYHFDRDNPIEKDRRGFLGYDGRHFKIKLNDDTTYETNNLWCNGDVPEKYKDKLKDNAVFVKGYFTLSDETVIPVKSVRFGELNYKSKKNNAVFKWQNFGSVLNMTIAELKEMKENNPLFLYEPYVAILNMDAVATLDLLDLYEGASI